MHCDWRACCRCSLRDMVHLEHTSGWTHLLAPSRGACSCQSGAHAWCSHCSLFGCMRPCAGRPKRDVRGIPEEGFELRSQGCAACPVSYVRGSRRALECGPLSALPAPCVGGSSEPPAAAPPFASDSARPGPLTQSASASCRASGAVRYCMGSPTCTRSRHPSGSPAWLTLSHMPPASSIPLCLCRPPESCLQCSFCLALRGFAVSSSQIL